MRSFAYEAPSSIAGAVALLGEKGERARLLVGGTDLLVQLRLGLYEADWVIDVKRIPELRRIIYDPGEGLVVGAAVTCAELGEHPAVGAFTRACGTVPGSSAALPSRVALRWVATCATPHPVAIRSQR